MSAFRRMELMLWSRIAAFNSAREETSVDDDPTCWALENVANVISTMDTKSIGLGQNIVTFKLRIFDKVEARIFNRLS
jgi:hypothetical protein